MAVSSPALNVSDHILTETRKLLRAGWLTDPTKVRVTGSRGDGTIELSIASRRPGHAPHDCTVNQFTLATTCDALCPGAARFGRCAHQCLSQCLVSGAAWEWVMGFTVGDSS